MNHRLGVTVVYRNGQMEPVYEKNYTMQEYCDMLREDQLRLITDVEDMAYITCNGKRKEEWPDKVWESFCKIKHKLLDKAGDIGRLPSNLTVEEPTREDDELGSFVKKLFRKV